MTIQITRVSAGPKAVPVNTREQQRQEDDRAWAEAVSEAERRAYEMDGRRPLDRKSDDRLRLCAGCGREIDHGKWCSEGCWMSDEGYVYEPEYEEEV